MAKATLRDAYLLALERLGERSPSDLRRELGISARALASWRKRPGFVRLELDTNHRGRGVAAPTEEEYIEAEAGVSRPAPDHRSPWDRFIESFRKTDDRIKSCRAAGLLWSEVEAQVVVDQAFAAAYEQVMQERNIRHEDAINRRGVAGDTTAAKAYLQANDARYKKSGDANPEERDVEAAFESWLRGLAKKAPTTVPASDLAGVDPERVDA